MHVKLIKQFKNIFLGDVVASYLVHLSPDQAVLVQALAGDIALCSWARHFTLTVCIKWVATNLMLGGGVTRRRTSIPYRGSRHTPSLFMLQKPG